MRLEITRRADLAVRALAELAATDGRCKSADLAAALGTTTGFVPQVVGPLVKAGWVASDPGPTGGYRVVVPLDTVSLLAVIEAVDGPTDTGRCVVAERPCDARDRCALHDAWGRARDELMATLAATPLSSMPARRGDRVRVRVAGGRR
jgi:Rrf2 family protein